jgi:hypothetical protein
MSTPKQRRRGLPRAFGLNEHDLMASEAWHPVRCLPGYVVHHTDGRIAREIKVRTNKNGTRFARVSIKGKQYVVKV